MGNHDGRAPDRLIGAEAVNDELEVGLNLRFEQVWHRYALAARFIMGGVIAAGLAGLLGSGPFSHRTRHFPTGRIAAIDFEPIARAGTPTQITFHVRPAPSDAGMQPVHLLLSSDIAEPFGLQTILPVSAQQRALGGGVVVAVPVGEVGDSLIRIIGKPTQSGPITMFVQADGGPPIPWTQFILP